MLIDRSHRGWAVFTLAAIALSSLLYIVYARHWPGGPSGRTWPGMLFGIVGTLAMLVAGLLSARKKTIRLRLGSLSAWLKAHIWLGLLSVPLIAFHAAFRWGGWLEVGLWILLMVVVASGIFGVVLQNIIPRTMKAELASESIPDQFGEICRRLVQSTDEKLVALCTPATVEAALARPAGDAPSAEREPLEWLASFHITTVRPFLGGAANDVHLASAEPAQLMFDQVRATLPATCHETVGFLERACDERRQLAEQDRMHGMLHGWLKVHIPVSVALAVFTVIHIVMSLYY